MKKASTTRRCEIVSRLRDDNGNILFDMGNLHKVLAEKECIKEYCYIIHDKDTYTEEDESSNASHKAGTLKPEHIHLLLRFETPQHFKYIGEWFGVGENFVSKIHGKWENAVIYQVHRNAPDKYQYPLEDVTANFDVLSLMDNSNKENYLDEILQQILDGIIREYNKTQMIDNLILVRYARQINEAFKVRAEHLASTQKERNTQVIFITGSSSTGKTTFAKQIAIENELDYFISSGSNDVMDGYAMQPCLILDDIRPSALGLSDLLKMLDNNTASTIKSRYKNKYLNCELIILTTVLDIDTFYQNVFSEHDEPITQLKRRCGTYIKMYKDIIYISLWDDKLMRYTNPIAYKNNILEKFMPTEAKTKQDVRNHVEKWIPFLQLEEKETIQTDTFHLQKAHDKIELITDEKYQEILGNQ